MDYIVFILIQSNLAIFAVILPLTANKAGTAKHRYWRLPATSTPQGHHFSACRGESGGFNLQVQHPQS